VLGGTAWVAALSQVAIPLGFTPVPLSLGTLAVLSVGAMLGTKRAVASLLLFLVIGLAGAPVFVGGGSGALPTLGYAFGYVAAAALVGRLARGNAAQRWPAALGAMALGSVVIYLFGVPYLAVVADLSLVQAVQLGLVPFLLGDLIKALAAATVTRSPKLVNRAALEQS